jgi:5,10-methylenetetrahydromethanopterin reductase
VGIDRSKPLTAMKETVEIMRRLLNMEHVSFEGEFIQVHDIELDVVHGRREPRNVPIMIGATGDKMMEMTGEIADGAVLNYCVPPEYNFTALKLLERGAKKSGRTLDDIDRPQLVVCSVDEDHDKAIDTTRELLTQYLAQQPHIAKASGVSSDVVAEIQSILGWPATHEQIKKAKHLVPEELILKITASGTPDEARSKVAEYINNGCTCPILYPVGGNVETLIKTFSVIS